MLKFFGVTMNKFFAIFLCSICCMVQANHLSDLEDAIIKSDIEGVKTILAIISLTERNKVGLIDLANDIILRRLKNIEWLRYKKPSDPLKSSDFDKEYKELIDRHMDSHFY